MINERLRIRYLIRLMLFQMQMDNGVLSLSQLCYYTESQPRHLRRFDLR